MQDSARSPHKPLSERESSKEAFACDLGATERLVSTGLGIPEDSLELEDDCQGEWKFFPEALLDVEQEDDKLMPSLPTADDIDSSDRSASCGPGECRPLPPRPMPDVAWRRPPMKAALPPLKKQNLNWLFFFIA